MRSDVPKFRYWRGSWRPVKPGSWVGAVKRMIRVVVGRCELVLTWSPRRGYWVRRVESQDGRPTRDFVMPSARRGRMKPIVLGGASGDGQHHHLAEMESEILAKCFPLVQHCAVTRYEDGTVREPGEFKVRAQGASWEIQVVDYAGKAFFRVTAVKLDDAFAMACLLLETASAPWEVAKWLHKPRGK